MRAEENRAVTSRPTQVIPISVGETRKDSLSGRGLVAGLKQRRSPIDCFNLDASAAPLLFYHVDSTY